MSEPVFMFNASDPAMQKASRDAQMSFRYFWRELSWERRRIVPGLDMAMVKLPFTDGPRTDGSPEFEHMWIGDIDFDGDSISGILLNSPNWLSSVREGDQVSAPSAHLMDWMMTVDGRAYGGFTVNLMRAKMGRGEREQHDQAWGLDFGDPSDIKVEIQRGQEPAPKGGLFAGLFGRKSPSQAESGAFKDHPMCVNMVPKVQAQLQADPGIARITDDGGWSLLHREALAGNLGVVKLLIEHGADPAARVPGGHTASDLARKIGWSELADFVDSSKREA